MPWIEHPETQDKPVSWYRWTLWHISEWLGVWSRALEHRALYGRWYDPDKDLPF